MKKAAFVFLLASFSTLVAAASNEVVAKPGDPKKEQKQESSFTLAQGYFNIFNIFSVATPPQADTLKVKTQEPTPSSGSPKK